MRHGCNSPCLDNGLLALLFRDRMLKARSTAVSVAGMSMNLDGYLQGLKSRKEPNQKKDLKGSPEAEPKE